MMGFVTTLERVFESSQREGTQDSSSIHATGGGGAGAEPAESFLTHGRAVIGGGDVRSGSRSPGVHIGVTI